MSCEDSKATISIRRDGTVHFTPAANREFGLSDANYLHCYRMRGGGGGTRPLLRRERQELGLMGAARVAGYLEDDPNEFMRLIQIKPRVGKLYRAWMEPKTRTIMVQLA
jgi:hypothetical protein